MFHGFLDRHAKRIFPLPAILFILFMMAFPLVYTFWNSLTGWSLSAGRPATYTGFKNYISLLTDERFLMAVVRMLYFTAIAMFFEVVFGVAIALLLDREFRFKRLVNSILLLPMMATPVAVAMVWLFMLEPTAGVVNFVLKAMHLPTSLWIAGSNTVIPSLALVDIWEWTPMVALIAMAGLSALPREPFEAAEVDGASYWQRTLYITLPMLLPTLSVATLLRLIDAIKTFDIIYTMTGGGPGFSSETLNIYTYNQAFSYFNFGYASSVLVIFFALVFGISLLVSYTRRTIES